MRFGTLGDAPERWGVALKSGDWTEGTEVQKAPGVLILIVIKGHPQTNECESTVYIYKISVEFLFRPFVLS